MTGLVLRVFLQRAYDLGTAFREGWELAREDGPFRSLCMDHTLTCCSNGGGRKAGRQTRVRHGNNDETLRSRCSAAEGNGKLTSLTNVSGGVVEDLSRRACLWFVGLGGGREAWDRLVVEYPAAVGGVADASSEDSEIVDSSRLTAAIAGDYPQREPWRGKRERRCAAIVRTCSSNWPSGVSRPLEEDDEGYVVSR